MSAFNKLTCDRCAFSCSGSDGELYVICEDGSEALCWHPGQIYTAEEVTGCNWEQLKKEERLRGREAYLCLNCGKLGYYGQYKRQMEESAEPYITRVPASEIHRSASLQCAACGHKRLDRLSGRMKSFGCLPLILPVFALMNWSEGEIARWGLGASLLFLVLIWDLPGFRLLRPVCPHCRKGRLRRQMDGMS